MDNKKGNKLEFLKQRVKVRFSRVAGLGAWEKTELGFTWLVKGEKMDIPRSSLGLDALIGKNGGIFACGKQT